jgi:hypothetical protein
MNPTQYELTHIAAMQTGTPAERARAALALWKACGDELSREARAQAMTADRESRESIITGWFAGRDEIPLVDLLREIMPQSKPEDRLAKYRAWMRQSIQYHERLTGEDLDAATESGMERDRTRGIPYHNAAAIVALLERFIEKDRREKNTARGKKGAAAKKILGATSPAQKTPQAKRKPRQARP